MLASTSNTCAIEVLNVSGAEIIKRPSTTANWALDLEDAVMLLGIHGLFQEVAASPVHVPVLALVCVKSPFFTRFSATGVFCFSVSLVGASVADVVAGSELEADVVGVFATSVVSLEVADSEIGCV